MTKNCDAKGLDPRIHDVPCSRCPEINSVVLDFGDEIICYTCAQALLTDTYQQSQAQKRERGGGRG